MHARSSFASFLAAVLLAGYYFAFEMGAPIGEVIEGEPLVPLAVESILAIEVTRPDGPAVRLERATGASRWTVVGTGELADQAAMNRVYRVLHEEPVLTSHEGDPAQFGLSPPSLLVVLSTGTAEARLAFGDLDPSRHRRYLLRGERRIGLVDAVVAQAFDPPPDAWLDRRLVRRDDAATQLQSIAVEAGGQHYQLVKREQWELDPGGSRVSRDIPAQISGLLNARHEGSAARRPLASRGRITFAFASGPPLILDVSVDGNERANWVGEAGSERGLLLARSHVDWLFGGPDGLRAPELLAGRSGVQYIARIEVVAPGGDAVVATPQFVEGGARRYALEPPSTLPEFSAFEALQVARALDAARVERTLSADPRTCGLDPPAADWRIQRSWTEHARDRETTTRIEVGAVVGGQVAVRLDGRPAILAVSLELGQLLRAGPLALRNRRLFAGVDLTRVAGVELTDYRERPPARYQLRGTGGDWTGAMGDRPLLPRPRRAVEQLLAGLEPLEVDRYLSPAERVERRLAAIRIVRVLRVPVWVDPSLPPGPLVLTLRDGAGDVLRALHIAPGDRDSPIGVVVQGGPAAEVGTPQRVPLLVRQLEALAQLAAQ